MYYLLSLRHPDHADQDAEQRTCKQEPGDSQKGQTGKNELILKKI